MNKYYYDFHLHSALSPCGDNDMTPGNIAGMAALAGLNIIALTDHNSCRNCPSFFAAAKQYGLIPVAGMELTTSEDIHLVCLFPDLKSALSFNDEIDTRRVLVPNRVDIFGEQIVFDENDEPIGTDDYFLPNATTVTLDEAPKIVADYGGACYPAHIDRQANGIISTLGVFPETPKFAAAELNDLSKKNEYTEQFPILEGIPMLVGSDAHYLTDIRDASCYLEIDDEPYSSEAVRKNLIKLLLKEGVN